DGVVAVERVRRQQQRGVVGEDVDVLERVELVGDDGRGRADVVGARRQPRARAVVEARVGGAVDAAGGEVEDGDVAAADDAGEVRLGDLADRERLAGRGVVDLDGDRGRDLERVGDHDGVLLRRGRALVGGDRVVEVDGPVLAAFVGAALGGDVAGR